MSYVDISPPSQRVADMYEVLTGDQFPRGRGAYLKGYAGSFRQLGGMLDRLGGDVAATAQKIQHSFNGKAARRLLQLLGPFAMENPQYLLTAGAIFLELANFLDGTAEQMEYMKLVVILELVELLAELAIAFYLAAFTGGGSVEAFLGRWAMARVLIENQLGRLMVHIAEAQVIGIALQDALDAVAQILGFNTRWPGS